MLLRHGLRVLQVALGALCAYWAITAALALRAGTDTPVHLPPVESQARPTYEASAYKVIGERALFREAISDTARPLAPLDALAESKLAYRLHGTLTGTREEDSTAALVKPNTGARFYVNVGDELEGARVERIERGRVVVRNRGRLEAITMLDAREPAGSEPRPSRRRGLSAREFQYGAPVAQTGGVVSELLRQARLRPALDSEGGIEGVVFESVRPDSDAADAGVQSGTRCDRANGRPIRGAQSLAAALQSDDGVLCLACRDPEGRDAEYCL